MSQPPAPVQHGCAGQLIALVHVYRYWRDFGGMGIHRRAGAAGVERCLHLHDLSAFHLWSGSVLPYHPWLQNQTETVAAGSASQQEMQALGTYLGKAGGMGTGGWLRYQTSADLTCESINAPILMKLFRSTHSI